MTGNSVDRRDLDGVSDPDLVFDLLSHARRRAILRSLDAAAGWVDVRTLASRVAERAADVPEDGGAGLRDRVVVSLHHSHLPRLADAGLLEYDPEFGTVRPTDRFAPIRRLLDAARGTEPERRSDSESDRDFRLD